jgi:tRNA G10  N-methylase Trm11
MMYAFVFGKNWKLSLAEILAYFKTKEIAWDFVDLTRDCLVLGAELDAEKVIEDLGGTLKIAEITKSFDFNKIGEQDFGDDAVRPLSFYGESEMLPAVKKVFRKMPYPGAYSNTDLLKKRITENILIFGLKTCYFGPTVTVSNPFDYMRRDDRRPVLRPLLAISPSRARILVNLSQAKKSVLDPFCGIGTIGQEAALLGVPEVYLSDIDKKIIEGCKKNMDWTKKTYKTFSKVSIKPCDAKQVGSCYRNIEAIATEPDLGPMLNEPIGMSDAEKIINYLSVLYGNFFLSAQNCLAKGGRVAIVLPCLQSKKRRVFTQKRFPGFRAIDMLRAIPEEYKDFLGIKTWTVLDEEREPGKKRITIREFCVFEKT